MSPDDLASWHRQLTFIAQERGYKPGWVAFKFKEKFGKWPADRTVVPEEPTSEVRSWVRSRMIAYAKAQQRAVS
jgi:DNA repair protein RadD